MDVVKIPDGETRDSFIKCRTEHFKRHHDLYKFILQDIHCYDEEFQTELVELEMKMLDIINKFEALK